MNKKIISIAATALCTLTISATALGADTKTYDVKCHYPSLSCVTFNENNLIKKVKDQLSLYDKYVYNNGFCVIHPDKNEPPVNEEIKPSLPESDTPSEDTDKPADGENTIISSNQTAKEAAFAKEVVDLINKERAKYGLGNLTQDPLLQAAAQERSFEQEKLFSHTRPDGSDCFSVLDEYGISYMGAGENIAYGQKTPHEVVYEWLISEDHKINIVSENYTNIGVGCYMSPSGTIYWTQMFTY